MPHPIPRTHRNSPHDQSLATVAEITAIGACMIVKCTACSIHFKYDETRFKGARVKHFQCTKCKAIFAVPNPFLDEAGNAVPQPPKTPSRPTQQAHPQIQSQTLIQTQTQSPLPPPPSPIPVPRLNSGVRLAYITGPKSSTAVELLSSVTIIGRDEGDIVTLDPETSRRHAMIEIMEDGTVWLQDLGSKNGTFTDEGQITNRIKLADQQQFICGKSAFMLLLDH